MIAAGSPPRAGRNFLERHKRWNYWSFPISKCRSRAERVANRASQDVENPWNLIAICSGSGRPWARTRDLRRDRPENPFFDQRRVTFPARGRRLEIAESVTLFCRPLRKARKANAGLKRLAKNYSPTFCSFSSPALINAISSSIWPTSWLESNADDRLLMSKPNFLTVRPEIFERGAVIVPHVGLNNLLDCFGHCDLRRPGKKPAGVTPPTSSCSCRPG
jgi:hypothetical protein